MEEHFVSLLENSQMFELCADIKSVNDVIFWQGKNPKYWGHWNILKKKSLSLYGFTNKICGEIFSLAAWKLMFICLQNVGEEL